MIHVPPTSDLSSKYLSKVEWRGDPQGHALFNALMYKRSVAVIGSRSADQTGLRWASQIAHIASQNDIIVISGGAQGIDEQVHLATTQQGGESLAILGCGLHHLNKRHRQLATHDVGLLTPFKDQMSARKWSFPRRNQLIAALADEVIVIQASTQSGSLSTARAALHLSKRVWVLTHLPEHPLHQGCLTLLTEGAHPLTNSKCWVLSSPKQDPLQALLDHETHPYRLQETHHSINTGSVVHEELPQHDSPLWHASNHEPQSLEQLALDAQMPIGHALTEATLLELDGWLQSTFGGLYQRAYGS